MSDNINIYLSTDKNYFDKCIIAIISILHNHKGNEKLIINILNSDLSENEFKIANSIKADCQFEINFIHVEAETFTKYTKNLDMKYLTVNAFYRFLIPDIAPAEVKKVIYLDCDLILNGDICELYEQDIDGYKAGVIEDKLLKYRLSDLNLKSDKYFNSGVLLLNLEEIRKTDLLNETFEFYKNHSNNLEFHDQDILNGIWDNKVKFLDERFNAQSYCFLRMKKRYKKTGVQRINNPLIIHYTGSLKPWNIYCKHKLAYLWIKYKQLSPYRVNKTDLIKFKIKRYLSNILYIIKEEKYNNRYAVFIFGIRFSFGMKK